MQGFEATVADFECGLDGRGSIAWNPGGLQAGGPWYAWEDPPTDDGDDINYWDVYSNKDNVDSPVDYELNFPVAQDWRGYMQLKIRYFVWRDDGDDATPDVDNHSPTIRVYAYDSDGAGNSDNNGFHFLGDHSGGGTATFSLLDMTNRDQVIKIKVRVFEGFFGGVASNSQWGRQRTHLYGISLTADRVQVVPDRDGALSTYSPYVMRQAGWDRYRMYFGRNETLGGVTRDRIYLTENFGDGVSGWSSDPRLVLRPDSPDSWPGERGLIHDPAVVVVGASWHMYYTGIDCAQETPGFCDFTGKKNAVFHATSNDGVTWQKHGAVNISGIPADVDLQSGVWGYGEPSILYEGGQFRLYFFSDRCFSCCSSCSGTVYLAGGVNGHDFQYHGIVSDKQYLHPEVRKTGGMYVLTGSTTFHNISKINSADPAWFPQLSEQFLFSVGPPSWWDRFEIGTPSFLPEENRVYYGGTSYVGSEQPLEESSIGVKRLP